MTHLPHFNFPAFHTAAYVLRRQGHEVFNPAEEDIKRQGFDVSLDNPTGDPKLAATQGIGAVGRYQIHLRGGGRDRHAARLGEQQGRPC